MGHTIRAEWQFERLRHIPSALWHSAAAKQRTHRAAGHAGSNSFSWSVWPGASAPCAREPESLSKGCFSSDWCETGLHPLESVTSHRWGFIPVARHPEEFLQLQAAVAPAL